MEVNFCIMDRKKRLEELRKIKQDYIVLREVLLLYKNMLEYNRNLEVDTSKEKEDVNHGRSIQYHCEKPDNFLNNDIVIFVSGGKIYGIGLVENNWIKVKKVFGEL